METKEFEIIEGGFEVFELDLLAEEIYGGNNCTCTNPGCSQNDSFEMM